MSTSRDYPAEPPRLPRASSSFGGTCAAALGRAALHRRLAFVHVYHTGGTSLTHELCAAEARAAAREAARPRSLASAEASLGPAADALRLRNWTLDLLNVGERCPQTRFHVSVARLREAHGGEATLHANALRFAVVRDPFAWFPSLFAHAVHELRTAPRFATAALLDAACAADPCDWRHCSKAARKAAADKEATPAVTARRFRAWVRELVSGRRPASHLCERPGGR